MISAAPARHGQRLSHCPFLVAEGVGKTMRLAFVDDDLSAERALHVGRAHGTAVVAHVQAMVLQALLAIVALAAGPARADGDPIALGMPVHAGPDFFHAARHLVAQHHRFLDAHGAEAAVVVIVQVGAADAAKAHLHAQLIGLHLGGVDVLDAQVVGGVNDESVHDERSLGYRVAVTPPST